MTNFEKYKDEIMEIMSSRKFGLTEKGIQSCRYDSPCKNCKLNDCDWPIEVIKWFYEDDGEPTKDDGEPSPLENKTSESRAKEAIKILKEFCKKVDMNTCVRHECPLEEWCKMIRYMAAIPEDWEV